MTRWFRVDSVEHRRSRLRDDELDPVALGKQYGLPPTVALLLWDRARREASVGDGPHDPDRAVQRFAQLVEHAVQHRAAGPGKHTAIEDNDGDGESASEPTSGKTTLVEQTARRARRHLAFGPGKVTRVSASPAVDGHARSADDSRDSHESALFHRALTDGHAARIALICAIDAQDQTAAVLASCALRQHLRSARGHLANAASAASTTADTSLTHELSQLEQPAAELLAQAPTVSLAELRTARTWELWDSRAAQQHTWQRQSIQRRRTRPLDSRRISPRLGALRGRVVLGSWQRSDHVAAAEAQLRQRTAMLDGLAGDSPLARLGGGGGDPLPDELRTRMEQLLGHSFAHVRVHTDLAAAQAASALGARALAVGHHIYFGPCLFQPGSLEGDQLLVHELTHVIQHDRGSLAHAAGTHHGLGVSQPSDAVEREATAMERAAHQLHAPRTEHAPAQPAPAAPTATQTPALIARQATGPDLSTHTLLSQLLDRLTPLVAQAPALEILRRQVQQDRDKPPADLAKLRRSVEQLNSALVSAEPSMTAIAGLRQPDIYLSTIAAKIVERVNLIEGELVAALIIAYSDIDPNGAQLKIAQTDLAGFADFVVGETLGPDGIERLIAQVMPLREQLLSARSQTGRAVLTRPADTIAGLANPRQLGGIETRLRTALDNIRRGHRSGSDVGRQIHDLIDDTRSISALISALAAHEQFIYWSKQLEDSVFGRGHPRELAHKYRDELDSVLRDFEKLQNPQTDDQYHQTAAAAANRFNQLAASAEFHAAVEAIQDRLGTISTIHLIEKIIVITAAAAITGGMAAEAAGGLATELGVGGLAGAASFTAEVVAFTTVSRMAEGAMIGPPENSYGKDLAINALTFGLLKSVNRVFARVFTLGANPSTFAKVAYKLGNLATVAVSLQMFAEAEYVYEHGSAMSGQQRASSIAQSAIVMAALELGHFIARAPAARGLGSIDATLTKQLGALGGERSAIATQLAALEAKQLTPEQTNELLAKIEDLYTRELRLFDAAAKRGAAQPALKAAIAAYQEQIASVELKLARAGVAGDKTGPQLFRQVRPGVVSYQPAGRTALDKFYQQQGGHVVDGQRPGELIGTLPSGEKTYFLTDELVKDEQRTRDEEHKAETHRKQLLDKLGEAVGPAALPQFTDLPTETLERLARHPKPALAKLAGLTPDELTKLLALPDLQLGRLLGLPVDQLGALAKLAPDRLAKLAALEGQSMTNLARRTPAELQRILALDPAEVKALAELKYGHASALLTTTSSTAQLRAAIRVCGRFMASGLGEKTAVERTVEIIGNPERLALMGETFQPAPHGTNQQILHPDRAQAHELAQALDYLGMKGGGRFDFGPVGLEGVEGVYVPEGAKQQIQVSMKVYTTTDAKAVLERVDQNATHIHSDGPVELFAYSNADAKAIYDLTKTPPPGATAARTFKRMTFRCRDGILVFDSGRWQPPR